MTSLFLRLPVDNVVHDDRLTLTKTLQNDEFIPHSPLYLDLLLFIPVWIVLCMFASMIISEVSEQSVAARYLNR